MDKQFSFIKYIHEIVNQNVLAQKEGFLPCTFSENENVEEILRKSRKVQNFVGVSDTCNGGCYEDNGSWSQRRMYTVIILVRHKRLDNQDRQEKMKLCRELFRQMISRILHDRHINDDMPYMEVERIRTNEWGNFLPDYTGMHFTIAQRDPEDLSYNESEWATKK